MNTSTKTRDRISAFADSELAATEHELALAALKSAEGRAAWDAYHQIGDVLRRDEMDVPLSAGFSARMAARLEAEPALAPITPISVESAQPYHWLKRFAAPVAGLAAVSGLAFVFTPAVMQSLNGGGTQASSSALAVSSSPVRSHASVIAAASTPTAKSMQTSAPPAANNLDEYLDAHRRLSPSVFNAAQLTHPPASPARTGSENESGK